jgi:hypothetical protein
MKIVPIPLNDRLTPDLWFKIGEEVDLELLANFYGMEQLEETVAAFLDEWEVPRNFYVDIRLDWDGESYKIVG